MKKGSMLFLFAIAFIAYAVFPTLLIASDFTKDNTSQDFKQESKNEDPLKEIQEFFNEFENFKTLSILGVEKITVNSDKFYDFNEFQDISGIDVFDNGNFVIYGEKYFSTKNELTKEKLASVINQTDDVIYVRVEFDCLEVRKVASIIIKAKCLRVDNDLNVTGFVPFVSKAIYCKTVSDDFVSINKEHPNVGYVSIVGDGAHILYSRVRKFPIYATHDVIKKDSVKIVSKGELIGKVIFDK